MPVDPLDQQLVEAVLTRPRRAKADVEEAKLAGFRPSRALIEEDEDEESLEDEPEAAVAPDTDDDDVAVEVVGEALSVELGAPAPPLVYVDSSYRAL